MFDHDMRDIEFAAELATVIALVRRYRPGLVAVGHGRDPASAARAAAFVEAWESADRDDAGSEILAVVTWPARAASWLRQAGRLVAGSPDVWVVADMPEGWAGFGPRLAATGRWRPDRTVAFAGLADPELPARAGCAATEDLSGATETGQVWSFVDGRLRISRPARPGRPD